MVLTHFSVNVGYSVAASEARKSWRQIYGMRGWKVSLDRLPDKCTIKNTRILKRDSFFRALKPEGDKQRSCPEQGTN